MPIGNVGLRELAEAVAFRVEDQVGYLRERGSIIEDTEDVDALKKGMGVYSRAYRLSFPPESIMPEPGFTRVILFRLNLNFTVLWRRLGNNSTRLEDPVGVDITRMVKDAIYALQGETVGLLNQGGIECGPARVIGDPGDSVQIMRFMLSGRSRESRKLG